MNDSKSQRGGLLAVVRSITSRVRSKRATLQSSVASPVSPTTALIQPPPLSIQSVLESTREELKASKDTVEMLCLFAGIDEAKLGTMSPAEIRSHFDRRISAASMDQVASMGIPPKDLPPVSAEGMTSFAEKMTHYNSLRPGAERDHYYAKHIAPEFEKCGKPQGWAVPGSKY